MAEERWVVVEFRGGPCDGDRETFVYPLMVNEVCVPARTFRVVALEGPVADLPTAHVYRLTDTSYQFDVVTIAPGNRTPGAGLEYLMRDKRPLIFTHRG